MGLFDRLFGKKRESEQQPSEQQQPAPTRSTPAAPAEAAPMAEEPGATKPAPATAPAPQAQQQPAAPPPRRLQVLFPRPPQLDGQALVNALERLHPSMRPASLDVMESGPDASGTAKWGPHVIEILVRKHPLPKDAAKRAIGAAHYKPELKDRARAHGAYLVLNYRGSERSPWEQYVALAALAAVFTRQGAVAVANVDAFTSAPTTLFDQLFQSPDALGMLRGMPPALLYCGFIKYNVPGVSGVWMRTEGAPQLGLPDLAIHAQTPAEGERIFNLFNGVLAQSRQSGMAPAAGQTLQLGPALSLRFRTPNPGEPFPDGTGSVLVIEPTSIGDQPAIAMV
jgi:hypothetical protein